MITRISTTGIFVTDHDKAVDFYVNKLGFEIVSDTQMEQFFWLEVAPKGAETPLAMCPPTPGSEQKVGGFSTIVFATPNMDNTYRELTAKGVTFTQPPAKQDWGLWAQFVDAEGNEFGLIEK